MRKVIKSVCLTIAILLAISFVGFLVSCDNSSSKSMKTAPDKIKDETGKLTDNMKREIQTAYYKKDEEKIKSPDQVSGVCYGVFDDVCCLMITLSNEMYIDELTKVEVGEYRFLFKNSNIMIVYCEEKFYSLTEAYESGILSDENLAELYILYNKVVWGEPDNQDLGGELYDEGLPMSSEIKREIQIAELISQHGANYEEKGFATEYIGVICYGIFDDVYCVRTWESDIHVIAIVEVKVGEYTFHFTNPQYMPKIYKEGNFYSLNEAYENGIISDENLAELYDYFK